jgi:hypothetical protein
MDCLRGMHKARSLGFYDEKSFDVEEYEHFEQVEVRCNGLSSRSLLGWFRRRPSTSHTHYPLVLHRMAI